MCQFSGILDLVQVDIDKDSKKSKSPRKRNSPLRRSNSKYSSPSRHKKRRSSLQKKKSPFKKAGGFSALANLSGEGIRSTTVEMNKLTPLKKFNPCINKSIDLTNLHSPPDFSRFSLALRKCEIREKKTKLNDENSTIGQHISPGDLFGQVGKSKQFLPQESFIRQSQALLWK